MSWDNIEKSAEKGPFSFAARIVFIFAAIIMLIMLVAIPLGWFGEASSVAKEEFGPRAALQKYEWFVDQAERINKMDENVKLFEKNLASVDEAYSAYGKPGEWAPDIRIQYNSERKTASDDLLALKAQRNTLVQEYNAQSGKFNRKPFLTRDDRPVERFEEYSF
jgi:hypothetical protein